MAMLSTFTGAYRAERAARRSRTPHTPLLERAARLAARLVPSRTAVLSVAGFGLLSAAAWMVALPLGLAAAGVSVLLLEYLTSGERR